MTAAADVLRALLADEDGHLRFKSAAKLIELAVQLRDSVELEERVKELERRLAGRGEGAETCDANG